ncbi:MAG: hypothetical protein Q4E57_10165 [Eubacteriales bacterium]|nr:hypothetical protein [Eubacteriales bacterium]
MKNILFIVGSNRKGSFNHQLSLSADDNARLRAQAEALMVFLG